MECLLGYLKSGGRIAASGLIHHPQHPDPFAKLLHGSDQTGSSLRMTGSTPYLNASRRFPALPPG
jgi:hypothetical protein